MDRQIIYPGQIPLETDLLSAQKNDMIGLAKLSAVVLGTTNQVNGLACTPNSPAALNVIIGAGEIYSLQNIDGTAYSSLAADTTHQIVKQGILLDAVTLSTPAPVTGGQSINYLVQAAYSDVDGNAVVSPYYNASNPATAYSGPANAGTTNNTTRKGACTVTVKTGVSAVTGSQVTPAPDAGNVGLWVVTVANGQATVTAPNIAQYGAAPILATNVALAAQTGLSGYAVDTGTANVYQVAFSPAIATVTDGMVLRFKAKTANTTASTFSANGLTASPIVGFGHSALVGGEIIANSDVWVQWNSSIGGGSWILLDSTGGAQQLPSGTYGVTASPGDNTTKIATTAYADAIAALKLGKKFLLVQDQKASGTAGGTGTAAAYATRALNTIVNNTIAGASLATNQITLPAGTYRVWARAPAYRVAANKIKLKNMTDVTTIKIGSSAYSESSASYSSSESSINSFPLVLAATKVIELQHWIAASTGINDFGPATANGDLEIYGEVLIVQE